MTIKGIITAGLMTGTIAMAGAAWAHQTPKAPVAPKQGAGMSTQQEAAMTATAELVDAKGAKIGTARFTEVADGVRIVLEAANLTPGVHGFHIHATAKCEGPDFKSAGGHFNPDGKQHGFHNPQGPHAGDLPNLVVDEQGKAKADFVAPGLTLRPGKYSLLGPDGTSLMIHAGPDDYVTDPAGNSGARVACGPIVGAQGGMAPGAGRPMDHHHE
ncbi:MAG TPA: superoxide dismutase family protein [Stenomitos sp.]